MTMIKKVARAIYDKYFENLIGCCEPSRDELKESHKLRLLESAKASIEASWQAAIDAALKE